MKTIINPPYSEWENLCKRPTFPSEDLEEKVLNIISQVQLDGDKALKKFALQFDKVTIENLKVSVSEIEQANAILEMRLSRLTSLEQDKIKNELKELLLFIDELESILASPQKILEIIKKESQELKQKYSEIRRTELVESE